MEEATDSRDVFDGASSSTTKASEAARLEQNGTERHASSKGPKSFAILVRVMWNAIIFYFERSQLGEAYSGIRLPNAICTLRIIDSLFPAVAIILTSTIHYRDFFTYNFRMQRAEALKLNLSWQLTCTGWVGDWTLRSLQTKVCICLKNWRILNFASGIGI